MWKRYLIEGFCLGNRERIFSTGSHSLSPTFTALHCRKKALQLMLPSATEERPSFRQNSCHLSKSLLAGIRRPTIYLWDKRHLGSLSLSRDLMSLMFYAGCFGKLGQCQKEHWTSYSFVTVANGASQSPYSSWDPFPPTPQYKSWGYLLFWKSCLQEIMVSSQRQAGPGDSKNEAWSQALWLWIPRPWDPEQVT